MLVPVQLLLLDLGDLVGVLVGRRRGLAHFALGRPDPAQESAERRAEPSQPAGSIVPVLGVLVPVWLGRAGQLVLLQESSALTLARAAVFGS